MKSPWLCSRVPTAPKTADDYAAVAYEMRTEANIIPSRGARERLLSEATRWAETARRKRWASNKGGRP